MSGPSMINNIASIASGMKAEDIQSQLGVAILKQTLDAQKMEMEALVQMMAPTQSPDPAVGQTVNVSA
jgi:hypothetical protein